MPKMPLWHIFQHVDQKTNQDTTKRQSEQLAVPIRVQQTRSGEGHTDKSDNKRESIQTQITTPERNTDERLMKRLDCCKILRLKYIARPCH
mmetsp:Transcript_13784/g.32068  ORF Transcript_13784/g.32068 Transcript_13784/m.32068 type:complete len:91 (+) Transcript_13784:627-899(+)